MSEDEDFWTVSVVERKARQQWLSASQMHCLAPIAPRDIFPYGVFCLCCREFSLSHDEDVPYWEVDRPLENEMEFVCDRCRCEILAAAGLPLNPDQYPEE